MRRFGAAFLSAACAVPFVGVAHAQRGMGDWMTNAYDAQRSGWVRNDVKISRESMGKPGFALVWKMKLSGPGASIAVPSLIDFYIGYRGFRSLGFFGAASNDVVAVDTDLSRVEWQDKYAAPKGGSAEECPGGMTAAVTRPTVTAYPPPPTGQGFGRGTPAKSDVGEPHEGAAILKVMEEHGPLPRRPRRTPPPAFNPYAPRVQWALALTSDGKLHSLWVSNGHEPDPGIQFVPPDAHALGLIAYGNTAYVATTGKCGGASNGIWALDIGSKKVTKWTTDKNIAGTAGPAVGPGGTLFVAAGDELVALAPHTLESMAIHKNKGSEYSSTPVVFSFKQKNIIGVATDDGRLQLLDASALTNGDPVATSGVFAGHGYAPGSLTSWQDPSGTRWILSPVNGTEAANAGFPVTNGDIKNGALVAWKVVERGGTASLIPGWISRDLISPLPPIVVNGVVFAVSSGRGGNGDPEHAVLYAFDSETGQALWSSGTTITSYVHDGGLAEGGSRVYVATHDGTQYAFGFPIEH